MGLLDADKVQRLENFGDDTCDLLEIIERSFAIEFSDDELVAAETVGLLGECITKKVGPADSGSSRRAPIEVFAGLRQLIATQIGMKEERITPATPFPQGLKIF